MDEKKAKIKKEIISWIKIVAIAFVMAIIITKVIIIKTEVVSGSMIPELEIEDHVIGNRLAYLFSDPERGDVIFFEYPKSYKELDAIDPELTFCLDRKLGDTEPRYHDESDIFVKRVIGLPGDVVEIKNGAVFVNDVELKEDYLPEEMRDENLGPYYVPDDSYFLLGDNRNISKDARVWTLNKFVKKKDIKAKVIFKYYPEFEFFKDPVY